MSKKRVYEFAKEKGHSSREIIELAADLGIEYGSHMNSMSDEEISKITAALEGKQAPSSSDQKQAGKAAGPKEEKTADQQDQKEASPKKEDKKKETNDHQKQADAKQKQNNNKNKNKNKNRNRRGMGTHGGVKGTGQNKKKNQNQKQESSPAPAQESKKQVLEYTEGMTIAEIADQLNRDSADLVKRLFLMGVVANQNQSLDKDTIEILAAELGIEAEEKIVIDETDFSTYINAERDEENLVSRPPVVTIMGHVDHGKTTLLDKLRDARVTEGEAGGITQHIGAYQLDHEGQTITFLDTPGHAAFTTMRARGADITDIAIIVVAADDGVMPQTVEAINHAKAAEVPIIIAVNKIDKPTANPDRVKQELTEHGIIPEEWGGDNIFVEISALHSLNLEELLEMIVLVAEIQELKADPTGRPIGTVIEARLDKSRGPVATVLIQEGTLKVGDPIVVGNTHGRVRTMTADTGEAIEEAGPSKPIEITGLNETPEAGDHLVAFEEEKKARAIGEERAQQQLLEDRQASRPVTLENLFDTLQDGEMKEVNLIVKADVRGSVEALASSLEKIEVDGVRVNIIHTGVGAINESDVTLAAASQAIIIGFSVRPMGATAEFAEREGVTIRTYNVIYDAIDDVESAMKGLLDPEFEEQVIGHLTVRETYKVSKIGTIAGCYVNRGKITRQSNVRLIRNGVVVYEGALASLRRYQDDVREVTNGFECGLMIEDFNDIKVDDEIEAYEMVEVEPA